MFFFICYVNIYAIKRSHELLLAFYGAQIVFGMLYFPKPGIGLHFSILLCDNVSKFVL